MVRLITAFACALVANADYICTTAITVDCQCLAVAAETTGAITDGTAAHTVWLVAPGATTGQSNFTISNGGPGGGAIAYTFPDGQELCVTHRIGQETIDMAPCDYEGVGGIFIPLTTGQLYHIGTQRRNQTEECLEPDLVPGHGEYPAVGECNKVWTISETPHCHSRSEMVIS